MAGFFKKLFGGKKEEPKKEESKQEEKPADATSSPTTEEKKPDESAVKPPEAAPTLAAEEKKPEVTTPKPPETNEPEPESTDNFPRATSVNVMLSANPQATDAIKDIVKPIGEGLGGSLSAGFGDGLTMGSGTASPLSSSAPAEISAGAVPTPPAATETPVMAAEPVSTPAVPAAEIKTPETAPTAAAESVSTPSAGAELGSWGFGEPVKDVEKIEPIKNIPPTVFYESPAETKEEPKLEPAIPTAPSIPEPTPEIPKVEPAPALEPAPTDSGTPLFGAVAEEPKAEIPPPAPAEPVATMETPAPKMEPAPAIEPPLADTGTPLFGAVVKEPKAVSAPSAPAEPVAAIEVPAPPKEPAPAVEPPPAETGTPLFGAVVEEPKTEIAPSAPAEPVAAVEAPAPAKEPEPAAETAPADAGTPLWGAAVEETKPDAASAEASAPAASIAKTAKMPSPITGKPTMPKEEPPPPPAEPVPEPEPVRYWDSWEKDIENKIGMKFKLIEPGTFKMGSPEKELKRDAQFESQFTVQLTKAYYIGVYEVTQAQWSKLMDYNPSKFKGDKLPVENISFKNAQQFIAKLNKHNDGFVYSLPTEAQWEYACRAGTTTPFWNGEDLTSDNANILGTVQYLGKKQSKKLDKTTDVGAYPPNPWGLYDMHGNVAEVCDGFVEPYPKGKKVKDYSGAKTVTNYAARGGGYSLAPQDCRSASREKISEGVHFPYIGVRVVCVKKE